MGETKPRKEPQLYGTFEELEQAVLERYRKEYEHTFGVPFDADKWRARVKYRSDALQVVREARSLLADVRAVMERLRGFVQAHPDPWSGIPEDQAQLRALAKAMRKHLQNIDEDETLQDVLTEVDLTTAPEGPEAELLDILVAETVPAYVSTDLRKTRKPRPSKEFKFGSPPNRCLTNAEIAAVVTLVFGLPKLKVGEEFSGTTVVEAVDRQKRRVAATVTRTLKDHPELGRRAGWHNR